MKRTLALTVALAFDAAGAVVWNSQRPSDRGQRGPATKADSIWYHASDAALLAKTGRPQRTTPHFFFANAAGAVRDSMQGVVRPTASGPRWIG